MSQSWKLKQQQKGEAILLWDRSSENGLLVVDYPGVEGQEIER